MVSNAFFVGPEKQLYIKQTTVHINEPSLSKRAEAVE
jgi:hypothetical protein